MAIDEAPSVSGEDSRGMVARARAGIHTWISRAGRGLLHATPTAIMTAMTAASLAPLLLPFVGGDAAGGTLIGQIIGQIGNVGADYVSQLSQDVVTRLRGEVTVTSVSEDTIRNVLERRLEAELDGSLASALQAEMAAVLKAVNAVGTSLEAAFRSDVPGLASHIGQAVRDISESVTEFAGLREDVLTALAAIQVDITRTQALQEDTLTIARDSSSKLDRVSVEISLLRRSLRQGRPTPPPADSTDNTAETPATEVPDVQPYPGLAAFSETDEYWFHGRDRLTAQLASRLRERLRGSSPLLVVGASGAGKSSLLNAGLIPELRDGRFAPGCADWPCYPMTPGAFPLRELAIRLGMLAELPTSAVLSDIETDPGRTPLIVRQALLTRDERRRRGVRSAPAGLDDRDPGATSVRERRLVLVIDQFEEVFTQCDGPERIKFIEAVCAMASGSAADPPPALVVICLRAGFVEECTAHPPLESALGDQFIVGPMRASELTAAIEAPARDAGLTVDGGLAATMLSDLGAVTSAAMPDSATYDPGALPLLAHALRETWERRERGRMAVTAYHAAGGIKEAIGKKADEAYDSLDANGQRVARELLAHMISVRADAEDTRRRMSRQALLAELSPEDAGTAARVLDLLEAQRLVTSDGESVQIAHEALLRHWQRLRDWLAEDRVWLRDRQRLTEQAHEWDAGIRHPDRLLRGPQLSDVTEQLTPARLASLGKLETVFLRASQRRRARAHRARLAFMSVLTVAVVVAAGLAFVARRSGHAARQQQAIAQSQRLAAQAQELADSEPATSLAFGLEAYRLKHTTSAISSLLTAQTRRFARHLDSHAGAVTAIAYDPDKTSHILASAGTKDAVTLWDTATNKPMATLNGTSAFYSVAFAPGGNLLAGAEGNGDTIIWEMPSGQKIRTLTGEDGTSADAVAFSPNGKLLATAGYGRNITLWRTRTFTEVRTLAVGGGPVWGIAFSHDSSQLAAACSDHFVRVWNLNHPTSPVAMRPGATAPVRSVAFSPDGPLLAAGDDSGTIRLWNTRTDALRGILPSGSGPVLSLAFSPDGSQLASGTGSPGTVAVRLWNVASQTPTAGLTGPVNDVTGVAFSPDGRTLASADMDKTVGLWPISSPPPEEASIPAVAASTVRGGPVVTNAGLGHVYVWKHDPPSQGVALSGQFIGLRAGVTPSQVAPSIALSQDGQLLAAPARGGGVAVWHTRDGSPAETLGTGQIDSVAFRPRTPRVVAGGSDNDTIYLWTGRTQTSFSGQQQGPVNTVVFSPGGSLVVAGGNDGTIVVGHVRIMRGVAHVNSVYQTPGGFGPVEAMAFSPDGHTLASASADGTVTLWNVSPDSSTPLTDPISLPGPTQPVVSVSFNSDGTMLAASAADHTISLWNVSDPHSAGLFATLTGLGTPTGVAFLPGTSTVAGAAWDGTAMFWNTSADQVAGQICAFHPPPLTAAQTGLGAAFKPVCPVS